MVRIWGFVSQTNTCWCSTQPRRRYHPEVLCASESETELWKYHCRDYFDVSEDDQGLASISKNGRNVDSHGWRCTCWLMVLVVLKPGSAQNIALYASPIAGNSFYLISTFSLNSTFFSFFFYLFISLFFEWLGVGNPLAAYGGMYYNRKPDFYWRFFFSSDYFFF